MADWGSLATIGSQLLGSYLSNKQGGANVEAGNEATAASRQLYIDAAKSLSDLTPPNLSALMQPLQQAVSQGEITPEQYVAKLQQQSAMAGIKIPQQIVDAQYKALNQMQDIATQGGMTAIDRAQLNNITTDIATQEQGKRQAIAQDAARRGISGSGLEEMQRISNQQGAATRESQQGLDVAAAAQKRALDAISNSGTMASNLRTQEYGQQSDAAKAQDMINQFNAQAAQTAANNNVAAANAAQAANLAQKYNVQNQNINAQAQDTANRVAAAQQDWNNIFNQNKQAAAISTGQAGNLQNQGNALTKLGNAQQASAVQGISNAVSGLTGGNSTADEEAKKKAAQSAGTGYGSTYA